MYKILFTCLLITTFTAQSQQLLTPEQLWKFGRVSANGITKDGKYVVYTVSTPSIEENKSSRKNYIVPIEGGAAIEKADALELLINPKLSADGNKLLQSEDVKVKNITGNDFYPELSKSNVKIYDHLNYRHWDEYEDGKFGHIVIVDKTTGKQTDIMPDEPYDCPLKPDGGDEDFVWNTDFTKVVYATKKKFGTAYAISTNTDLYEYEIATGKTKNLTEGNKGYDLQPSFNTKGEMAWLQMKRDGYEADKQDLIVLKNGQAINLTQNRDDIHVEGYKWSTDGNSIYFYAPINGTLQLFEVNVKNAAIVQLTKGDFDVNNIVGQSGNTLVVSRTDMNHAAELYTLDLHNGNFKQLTHVNDDAYATITPSKTERRFVKTVDGKDMLVWVIYPPNFDKTKKYPTLLYCQGGPQSALTQFYSFRWNFSLMAANGYIVVAPNRRGMPGHGTKWNEQISKDHGGIAMQDYLSAIDALSKESFVDKNRLGCVGASYGGYSAFMLAGMHNKRFKTFIAHDGIFDFRSMYGTTEELWFPDWDYGGNYWDTKNVAAQKSYAQFSPSNFVSKWNTPMLIFHGEKDYRVPVEQGLQAFQALQLKGIKSKLVLMPDENHWVLHAQTAQVWQKEFYKWLKETL
jgi:dipeptidyl aminopeptidase/acylaminoacyl peptidase